MKLREVFTASRIVFYGLLLIAALTVAVHVRLWFSGLGASPAATIYRTRTVYKEMPRDKKAEKPFQQETVTRQVKVLREKSSRSPGSVPSGPPDTTTGSELENRNSGTGSDTSQMVSSELLGVFQVEPLPAEVRPE